MYKKVKFFLWLRIGFRSKTLVTQLLQRKSFVKTIENENYICYKI